MSAGSPGMDYGQPCHAYAYAYQVVGQTRAGTDRVLIEYTDD